VGKWKGNEPKRNKNYSTGEKQIHNYRTTTTTTKEHTTWG